MLLRLKKPDDGRWFAWRPVWAAGNFNAPGGWVWLETVEFTTWECWGAGGYNYTRRPRTLGGLMLR